MQIFWKPVINVYIKYIYFRLAFIIKGINKFKTLSVELSNFFLSKSSAEKMVFKLSDFFFQRRYQYVILNICFLTSSSSVPTQIPNIFCFFSQCPVVYT